MTSEPDYLGAAVDAALEMVRQRYERNLHDQFKREAAAKVQEQRRARDEAIWHLTHETNMSSVAISDALRSALVERGMTEESVRWVGISHDTVRNIAERPSLQDTL